MEMDSLVPTWTHLTSFFASVIIPTVAGWLCDLNVNISSFGAVAEYCSLGTVSYLLILVLIICSLYCSLLGNVHGPNIGGGKCVGRLHLLEAVVPLKIQYKSRPNESIQMICDSFFVQH